MKPRIAVFSLTSCEGCSLAILELENELLDLLAAVEIVNFREAMTERDWNIDIAFVDGAVSTPEDEKEVQHIREHCRTLVAIGACACLGGVNTLKNHQEPEQYRSYVYGRRAEWFPTIAARPISAVVKVDYELPGCPIHGPEFLRLVKHVLAGRPFRLPEYAVCVECKRRGNLCVYERGQICLGPITRAGCEAICPSYGSRCEACRGLLGREQLAAASINLRETWQLSPEQILSELRLFGAYQDKELP